MAITWETIRAQFTDDDIQHMKDRFGDDWDLSNCTFVWNNRAQIWDAVSNDRMPLGNPWPQPWKDNFQAWMSAADPGCPKSTLAATEGAITWQTIRSQFTDDDINHMKEENGDDWDLSDCNFVWTNRKTIWGVINSDFMPPNDPWPSEWKDNFQKWMNGPDPGCPKT